MTASPRFDVGDAVIDTEVDDPERMYVVDPARGTADEIYIEALEGTVADVNPDYPADDPVVSCIHESWLRHNVGERWHDWRDEDFADRLRAFAAEWSLSLKTYDYPEHRLAPADGDHDDADAPDRASTDREGQTSMDDWVNE